MNKQNASFPARLDHLVKLISGHRFLRKQGLGNEVPFFICPFKVSESNEMGKLQDQLSNQLAQRGIQILRVNLYDLCHDLLVKGNDTPTKISDWDWCLNNEANLPKSKLLAELQGILDVESAVVPEIVRRMEQSHFEVMFINGIGEVFPYIRSHNVLNNLQSSAKEHPTVFFFPGEYSHSLEKGASLDLFGRLRDDKYYRAFNIYDCEVE